MGIFNYYLPRNLRWTGIVLVFLLFILTFQVAKAEAAPVAGFSGTPVSGEAPLAVTFTDASTGDITSWSWNFGDGGTSTEQNPSHTYTSVGTYTVSLIVTGPDGSGIETKADYITVYAAPVANFTGDPTSGFVPQPVYFTNTSTGIITSYSWDFGDGGTSTLPSIGHTYTTAGTFTVSLTVTGPGGSNTKIRTSYINVSEVIPIANFSANLTSGIRPLTVQFTDKSLNTITSWSWDFGDGQTSTEQNPIHTYTAFGAFSVTLTVTGPNGSDTLQKVNYIHVTDIIVDRSPGNVGRSQVAADGNGHVYAVWEDTRNGSSDIYFNYSSDYGFTWQTADRRLDTDAPGASDSSVPQIACDDNGHVYVVWEDERNGRSDVYFNYSSDYGTTWQSSDKKLGMIPYNPNPQFPMVACDNNGHVYVAWNDNYFNASNDYGVTWLAQARRISTIGGEETQLACDQNGHVYVTWRLGTMDVVFNYSIDYGNTWQSLDRIVSNKGAKPYGSLSLDSDESGHVYVAWHDGRTNADSPDIYFNSSSDYGNTWRASDVKLNTGTPGTTYSIWPEVACDETGHVYVTWYDRRNSPPGEYIGDIYLNYSSDYGNSWQGSDMRLDTDSPGAVDSGYPEIASDGSGHIYVIWTDDQAGVGLGLYVNYSLDYATTWLSTNEKIGSSGFHPQMATDGSRFYIIWDYNDIFFNEVSSTEVPPFRPADPFPVDGATQIGLTPVLSWRFGDANLDDILTYDIYFGTLSPPSLVSSNQAETIYAPGTLTTFTTYYWQVVARDSETQTAGMIWSFKTISGPPEFIDFSPANGATGVALIPTLSWTAIDPDGDPLTYDVYFGKTNPPPLLISNYSSNTFNPGMLSRITVFYWKVVARDTHGTTTVGPVLSFTTINEPPQFNIYSFTPRDQTTGVDLAPTLEWSAHDSDPGDTITYDIYFGTSSSPPPVSFNCTTTSYSPGQLSHFTVYYWKIVARDNHGAVTESSILSFRTLNHPPQFINYDPPGYATGVSITPTLRWNATDSDPGDIITYDIYFGTSSSPPLVLSNQTARSYSPGQLSSLTQYYWKIVARDPHGAETALPVLFFTTASAPPQFVDADFSPPNGATGVALIPTLSWTAIDPDGDPLTYDVYFGEINPPPLVPEAVNQTTSTYKPKPLSGDKLYYWKIVARDNHGVETASPILSFITGTPLVMCNLVPNATAIQRGGTLELQATVTNNTDKAGTVLFATKVTLPNGNKYPPSGYLVSPRSAYLGPYGSKSVPLLHTIPITAPLGTYTYHGYVGNYGKGIYHECQFDFEVTH